MTLTPDEARAAILAGGRVRVTVAPGHELVAWLDDGMVISRCVAGWAEGTVEPVCAATSDYLAGVFLAGGRGLALEPVTVDESNLLLQDLAAFGFVGLNVVATAYSRPELDRLIEQGYAVERDGRAYITDAGAQQALANIRSR